MSRHDPAVSLRQMLDHSHEAAALVQGRTRADLSQDRLLNLALTRLLEIVGEAASRVPAAERERNPAVPWSAVVGLRNRLIHAYDRVDPDILWNIVTRDLPELNAALERILSGTPRDT